MGGNHFTVLYIISKNRYRVTLTALANSKANRFAFINTQLAINIAKFLNIKAKLLVRSIQTKGFDGRLGKAITYTLFLHFSLNR